MLHFLSKASHLEQNEGAASVEDEAALNVILYS